MCRHDLCGGYRFPHLSCLRAHKHETDCTHAGAESPSPARLKLGVGRPKGGGSHHGHSNRNQSNEHHPLVRHACEEEHP